MKEVQKDITLKNFFTKYIFMLWDGLVFFGTNEGKLPRLRGKKSGWLDKYSSVK